MDWEPTKYRIYFTDGNRLVIKAERNFLDRVHDDHKRFFFVGGYLVNTNQITFIEKL